MRLLASLAQPFLRTLDSEQAHRAAIAALRAGLHPRAENARDPLLRTDAFALTFANPLGMAAGFDKNGEVPHALLATGFGFAEIGSVTPRRQPGNPKPRIFRLPEYRAAINRLGFNNDGHAAVFERLANRRRNGIVGVNVGANKDSPDRVADYALGLSTLGPVADYITINVSSPNTPGLRALQEGDELIRLLDAISKTRETLRVDGRRSPPILLKVAPDIDHAQIEAIARSALDYDLDGLIVSNTTLARVGVEDHRHARETGGLSGQPLFHRSTVVLARFFQATGGHIPLIGVGGIASGADACQKILAGATLVQLYTGLIYGGFGLVEDILSTLVNMARREGLSRVQDAVGRKAAVWANKEL